MIFKKSLEKYIGIEKKLLSQILKILVTTCGSRISAHAFPLDGKLDFI